MTELTRQAIDLLITEQEMQAGFKDVEAESESLGEIMLRLRVPAPAERKRLFEAYVATQDRKALVGQLVEADFSGEDFMDSLTPNSLTWLKDVAVGICVGPDEVRRIAEMREAQRARARTQEGK